MLRFYVLVFLFFRFISLAHSQDEQLEFDLKINPDFAKYEELLLKPSVFAMALQSSGLHLSDNMTYITPSKFKISFMELEFIEQEKYIYEYLISLKISLGITEKLMNIPVYVNLINIKTGSVKIILDIPTARVIPDEYITRLKIKINKITSLWAQERLLSYLTSDQISPGINNLNNVVGENIIFDTILYANKYTNPSGVSFNKAISDKVTNENRNQFTNENSILLIMSFLIWLVCLPYFLNFLRKKRLIKDIK